MTDADETLTLARFAQMAQAYGGEIARWPASWQAAARQMAREPAAAALLAQEQALDAMLDLWRVPAPSPQLRQTVAASWRTPFGLRARLWWSALGLGAALAGMGAGVAFGSLTVLPTTPTAFEATAFGELGSGEG